MKKNKFQTIYNIHECDFTDINKYLIARNRDENIKQSFNKNKIDQLDHYNWWFENNISSFKLEKKKEILIFFYHYVISIKHQKYLISGWFNSSDKTSIQDIIYALNWQRDLNLKNLKAKSWISFVKKDNILAQKYSPKLGWKKISQNHELYKNLRIKFNMAKSYVYIRE